MGLKCRSQKVIQSIYVCLVYSHKAIQSLFVWRQAPHSACCCPRASTLEKTPTSDSERRIIKHTTLWSVPSATHYLVWACQLNIWSKHCCAQGQFNKLGCQHWQYQSNGCDSMGLRVRREGLLILLVSECRYAILHLGLNKPCPRFSNPHLLLVCSAIQVTPCACCSWLCLLMDRQLLLVQGMRHCASGACSRGSRPLVQMWACCRCPGTLLGDHCLLVQLWRKYCTSITFTWAEICMCYSCTWTHSTLVSTASQPRGLKMHLFQNSKSR